MKNNTENTPVVGGILVPEKMVKNVVTAPKSDKLLAYDPDEAKPLTWVRELLHHPRVPGVVAAVKDVVEVVNSVTKIKGPAGVVAATVQLYGKAGSYLEAPQGVLDDWFAVRGWYRVKLDMLDLLADSGLFTGQPSREFIDTDKTANRSPKRSWTLTKSWPS